MASLLDMRPRFPVDDTVDIAVAYSVDTCLLQLAAPLPPLTGRTNVEHVLGAEFAQPVFELGVPPVLLVCAEEEVIGSCTGRVVALMTNQDSGRDRAVVDLPAESVCLGSDALVIQDRVPPPIFSSRPSPATLTRLYSPPKGVINRTVSRYPHSRSSPGGEIAIYTVGKYSTGADKMRQSYQRETA